jgi:hypothetical protein
VLEGHALRAAGHQLVVPVLVDLVVDEQVGGAVEPEDVGGQRARVVLRARDARVAQPRGRVADRLLVFKDCSPFSGCWVSRSTIDWMTGSRSPSSTCMRLFAL